MSFSFCNQCKQSLEIIHFDIKTRGRKPYTRCKKCRLKHNKQEKEKYVKRTCSQRKLCKDSNCKKCFEKSFANYNGKTSNDKFKRDCWHPTKNGGVIPGHVFRSTGKKYWFICDICNHDFDISPNNLTNKNRWCPYCCIPTQKLCQDRNCEYCFKKSLASFEGKTTSDTLKINCWHPVRNGDLTPRDITLCSNKKYWFHCNECEHDFDIMPTSITRKGNWCIYCAGQKLCGDEDCNSCFEKSLASFDGLTINDIRKMDCWHLNKNTISPNCISKHSENICWFHCDVCFHDFPTKPSSVSRNKWCSYCSNKKLCDNSNCDLCFNKSFESSISETVNGNLKKKFWNKTKNKGLWPRNVFKTSNKKYWFDCDSCLYPFSISLNNLYFNNCWCPTCKNKTSKKLYKWLSSQTCITDINCEYSPPWCSTDYTTIHNGHIHKSKYKYRYDFLITFHNNTKLIIELDGEQHYKQVMKWKSPFLQQIRDKYKEFKARQYNINIYRCIQVDVYHNKNNWKQKLKSQFQKYIN
jgi:hypothetical protein